MPSISLNCSYGSEEMQKLLQGDAKNSPEKTLPALTFKFHKTFENLCYPALIVQSYRRFEELLCLCISSERIRCPRVKRGLYMNRVLFLYIRLLIMMSTVSSATPSSGNYCCPADSSTKAPNAVQCSTTSIRSFHTH